MAFAMAAVMAKDTDYVPVAKEHKDKILAQTKMAANGQEVSADVQGAGQAGHLSLRLHVPRPLLCRHEGQP